MYILGISALYHDSAASLIYAGEIVAAAQEERFTRVKHDSSFPVNAIKYCLDEAGISANEISCVVFYEKPFLKFERLLETYFAFAPKGFRSFAKALPLWVKEKLFQKTNLIENLNSTLSEDIDWNERLFFCEHHLSHAASAFFPSPFESAAVLTLDGVGEWATASIAEGHGNKLDIVREIRFPHSLGLLYSAFTYYLGFKVNSGEYKVMGLAPYGNPIYSDLIKEKIISVASDGSFKLDMSYFDFATGLKMTNGKFDRLFGGPPRVPESELTQREMDLAASIQVVLEEVVVAIGRSIAKQTGESNLCLAGGVALNCVANGVLLREKIFDNIWVQPAAGDAGGSLGAALSIWHMHFGNQRQIRNDTDGMKGAFLGPEFSDIEIRTELDKFGAVYTFLSDEEMIEEVSEALSLGKAVGWMQGRMEFGPRALGARSILADPRSDTMQKRLNLKIKYRESFRPFAPSVLSEYAAEWFEDTDLSPYMLFVTSIVNEKRCPAEVDDDALFGIERLNKCRSLAPAITHVDYSARVQIVDEKVNPTYHSLISKFNQKTGCPMLVNTSFNVRGEPIVCSPYDALKCFFGTGLDVLSIGGYLLKKENQPVSLLEDYFQSYELD